LVHVGVVCEDGGSQLVLVGETIKDELFEFFPAFLVCWRDWKHNLNHKEKANHLNCIIDHDSDLISSVQNILMNDLVF